MYTNSLAIIIIIMYIYHELINTLSAHVIHINLNMIFYTNVEHSPTKTIYIKYYTEKQTHTHYTHTHYTHTHANTHIGGREGERDGGRGQRTCWRIAWVISRTQGLRSFCRNPWIKTLTGRAALRFVPPMSWALSRVLVDREKVM